jgi:hypothetical protein
VRSEIRRRFKSDSISVGVVRRPGFSAASCRFTGLDGARLEFGPGGFAAPRAIGLRTIQPDSRRVAQHVCPEMPAEVAEDANAEVRSTASPVEPGFTSRSESVAPAVQTVVALSSSRSQRRVAEAPASRHRLRFRREPGAVAQRARRRAPARLNRMHRESHDRLPEMTCRSGPERLAEVRSTASPVEPSLTSGSEEARCSSTGVAPGSRWESAAGSAVARVGARDNGN